jgi:hypothetical protein
MALIKCSDCGRMVSDRAAVCIGCGAPVSAPRAESSFNLAPEHQPTPPLSRAQLRRRMHWSGITFIAGMLAAAYSSAHSSNRLVATLAALLLTCGLCWLLVAVVQNVTARRQ